MVPAKVAIAGAALFILPAGAFGARMLFGNMPEESVLIDANPNSYTTGIGKKYVRLFSRSRQNNRIYRHS